MSFRKRFFTFALLLLGVTVVAQAQTGPLRGHVIIKQEDGTTVPASEAVVDVFRTDVSGTYHAKANKKGEFVFAGLAYIGEYVVAASHPHATPSWIDKVNVKHDFDYEITLTPGNGRRLTYDEIKASLASASGSSGTESAADRAKLEEKNAEIESANKKVGEINALYDRSLKAGNEALRAKNYDEAISQYDVALKADPEHPGAPVLLTNESAALRSRGVDRYNAGLQSGDEATRTAAVTAAKQDWRDSVAAASKAVAMLKTQGAPPEAAQANNYRTNLYFANVSRAESMRLFVKMVDSSQVDAAVTAYEEYIATEIDPVKKSKAEHDLAQLLFDAGAIDKAQAEYKKLLERDPNDPDALANTGLILFNIGATRELEGNKEGAKAIYQEAANYLKEFVDKAPDSHPLKAGAKEVLENLKTEQNVQAEKPSPPSRRRRP